MEKWYKGLYRRQLVDMHINDGKGLMEKFTPEKYVECLKLAHIQAPMIYIQSHTGLCNYPTETAKTHDFFIAHPGYIHKTISLCKKEGMKTVAYYSLVFNNWAAFHHPEWQMIDPNGKTWTEGGERYGLCCPNNEEYRAFVTAQIKEIKEQHFEIDGIFYDMPYYEVVCMCPACQKRWQKETGLPLPKKVDFKDETWNLYQRKRQQWMGDFTRFVKEETNKYLPGVTVEYNYAASIACDWLAGSTELINENSEFTGGDLYGDLYSHSFASKYYYTVTQNQPFEYMTCRCNASLREHTISKPEAKLEAEIMLTSMHHGASLSIDAINPDGTLDKRVYKRLGKAFEKMMPYEQYMDKGELYSEIAIYFDSTTQFAPELQTLSNKDAGINAGRTLTENGFLYNVIANGKMDNLGKYQLIIAPELYDFDNNEVLKLIDYVREGGTLYLSGKSDKRLIKEFFDTKIKHFTFEDSKYPEFYKERNVQAYITPITKEYKKYLAEYNNKYPLPIVYNIPFMEDFKGESTARLVLPKYDPNDITKFVSIHSNPPAKVTNKTVMAETSYGKGKVIWSAAAIEGDKRTNFKDIFINIIKANISPIFSFESSPYVEPIVFKDGDNYYVNLFDLNHEFDPVNRKVTIFRNDGNEFALLDLKNKKEILSKNGKIKAGFTKYVWYKVSPVK